MQPIRAMNSKARVAGHPIHPMVIGFPIALFTATVACLLAFIGTHDSFYYRAAATASSAGVLMALLAAIPGAVDALSLPKGSQARRTGLRHASFAAVTIALFALAAALLVHAWVTRAPGDGDWQLDATAPLAVSVAGLVTLVIVAVLGWTLVQTHHVGVRPVAPPPLHEPDLAASLEDESDDVPGIIAPHVYTTEPVTRH